MKRGREGGVEALKAYPPTRVKPRLSAEQKAQLPALLARGAEAYGFRGDVWTARRVAEVIARTFGVRYHRDHVGCLLRETGWSRQQPIERASQRNEEAIKQWSEQHWPPLEKAEQDNATIVWVDEAGFYLLPMTVRTWTPHGRTPVLRVLVTRDHLSCISSITPDGRLFLQVRPASSDAAGGVGFLRGLLRKIAGKVMLIWDGSPIHRGQPITDFLKRGAAKRLHVEHLPGSAPDLNLDEGIWNDLKRVELGNVCCRDLDQ